MSCPPVVDVTCVCQMQQAHASRLNTIAILKNADVLSDRALILIPGTKRGIQAMGELLLLGYPVQIKLIEEGHVLQPGSLYLEVSDTIIDWSAYRATVRFMEIP